MSYYPEVLRPVPGYVDLWVTRCSRVFLMSEKNEQKELTQNFHEGYVHIHASRKGVNYGMSVHRAVALAWVFNPNPEVNVVVNHLDGCPFNNYYKNLEWTTYSGNNYHAVNTGLRPDAIACLVRDFYTKEVFRFSSTAQAAEFMGLPKDRPFECMQPKKFGSLVEDRYEVKYESDPKPWFYENRDDLIPVSRYQVVVTNSAGERTEVYSNREMLKAYQLYDSPSKSIPSLAAYGNEIHPDLTFTVYDSYANPVYRENRTTERSFRTVIVAVDGESQKRFESMTACAAHFGVDRSVIKSRLDNGKTLDRWTFKSENLPD
jgi:hypothetical protein